MTRGIAKSQACQSANRAAALATCGPPSLLNRSYTLRARWPFDAFHLVMETEAGTCNLYHHPSVCCAFTQDCAHAR